MARERRTRESDDAVTRKTVKSEGPVWRVFVSYSHKDERWLQELNISLKNLSRSISVASWDDTRLRAGSNWREEIDRAIRESDLAIIVGSRNFMASDFIVDTELLSILASHRRRGLPVLWIAVSYFNYESARLGEFQALNDPSRPLCELSRGRRDKEWVDIERRIKGVIEYRAEEKTRRVG